MRLPIQTSYSHFKAAHMWESYRSRGESTSLIPTRKLRFSSRVFVIVSDVNLYGTATPQSEGLGLTWASHRGGHLDVGMRLTLQNMIDRMAFGKVQRDILRLRIPQSLHTIKITCMKRRVA